MAEVKLYGTSYSLFASRVVWALKLKGVDFEYVEENLREKSPELLKFNPVHKKIPVLVHNGQPICESLIIVNYIDETWPENPLLPVEPHARAKCRFWVKYIEDKIPTLVKLRLATTEEELDDAKREAIQFLETIEEYLTGDKVVFGGDKIGYLDIAMGSILYLIDIVEEVLGLGKLVRSGKFPRLEAWFVNFLEHPVIKDNSPDCEKLVKLMREALPKRQ